MGQPGAGAAGTHALRDIAVLLRAGHRPGVQRPGGGQYALLSRTAADRGQRGRGRPHHPAGAEPHPQELSRHPRYRRDRRRLRRGHRRRRPHLPAHFQFDPGRHCGQVHLVPYQVHLQRRQEPLRGHQRGPDHLRGSAAVPQGPPPGRHRHRRPDYPLLSGVSGLLPAGAAAHPHH